jgi:predicted component of type VI protein secretion system
MAALVVNAGPLAGRRLEVKGALVLGREESDVTIEDTEISRHHAVVRPSNRALEIEDLGSLNGTWVNGVRIQGPTPLRPGDVIHIGTTSITVEVVEPRSGATVVTDGGIGAVPPAGPPRAGASTHPPLASFSPPRAGRPAVATRLVGPTVLAVAVVVATAVALVLYFGFR